MFTSRIQEILTYYNLSASAFAEKMGVGRSSISHITSGRNKPSLEFVLHILENFKEVNFDWLMFGKGNFPASKPITEEKAAQTLFSETNDVIKNEKTTPNLTNNFFNEKLYTENRSNEKIIERIVVFFSDKTFVEYKN